MSERRGPNSDRPNRGSGSGRPGGFNRGGGSGGFRGRSGGDDRGPRGPRRDDDRPPRRDDDRPARGRFDRDDRAPRRFDRDDRAPRGRFDRDDRAPRRDDDRPARGRFDRDDRAPRRFDRDDRAPRRFDRDDRAPRRDDDRPARGRFDRDDRAPRRFDRDDRAPRRDDGDRPRRDERFNRDDRPARSRFDRDDRAPRRDDGDRPRRDDRFNRDDRPRRFDRDDRGSRGRFDRDDRDRAPRTAAQERSSEVRARIGERRTSGEMSTAPDRTSEIWVDEGSTRPTRRPTGVRAKGTGRAQKGGRKEVRALDSVVEEFERKLGSRASVRALKRYEAALQAFEAHRYEEARKILNPMSKEYSEVSAVHEMLGLCLYRAGQWKRGLQELETAVSLNPEWIFNHPVIQDCHRALGNHTMVEKYWRELSEASPHPELLAEGRIVMAGSLADRKQYEEALRLMEKAAGDIGRPAEFNLRQWFVIADLYDKQGNVIMARQFFERIARHDPQFVDVAERLSTLGA
jgi:hypothetical protein